MSRKRSIDRTAPEAAEAAPESVMARMVHELQVHQVELKMQNEELREARGELERSNRDLTDLYDFAPVGYFSVTAAGTIDKLNLLGARMLGRERSWLTEQRLADFIASEHRRTFTEFLASAFAGAAVSGCEVALETGTAEPLIVRLTERLAADGRTCRIAAMDVSEQRRLEIIAHQKHEELDRIFNLSSDLLALFEIEGKGIRLNPAFSKILGYAPAELLEPNFFDWVHPDDLATTLQGKKELRAGRELMDIVIRMRHRDGSYRWLEWRVTPCRGGMVCAMARDITQRREFESTLRQTEDALKEAHAQLETKVQQRTRQLRALATELTMAEERERRRVAELIHDGLQQLLVVALQQLRACRADCDAADTAADIEAIEALLRDAIHQTRTLTAELSPSVLHQCGLAAALHWLRVWSREKFGLELTVDVEEGVDPGMDVSVPMFLCVRELLFNVFKHSGTTAASLSMRRPQPSGDLIIEVSDNGAGFDEKSVRAREGVTGGFGLFSVRERLEMLAGSMEIVSSEERGSRIILRVPSLPAIAPLPGTDRERLPDNSPGEEASAPQEPPRTERPAAGGASGTIRLVVADDHLEFREDLARMLAAEPDLELVGQAADGWEAVELARQLQPQFVLMDWNMPRMNGLEATALIRHELPAVAVLGITSQPDVEQRVAMIRAGALDLLPKDTPASALVATLRIHASRLG